MSTLDERVTGAPGRPTSEERIGTQIFGTGLRQSDKLRFRRIFPQMPQTCRDNSRSAKCAQSDVHVSGEQNTGHERPQRPTNKPSGTTHDPPDLLTFTLKHKPAINGMAVLRFKASDEIPNLFCACTTFLARCSKFRVALCSDNNFTSYSS